MNVKTFLVGLMFLVASKFVLVLLPFGLAIVLSSFESRPSMNDWRAKYHP
jgi:hypothetical protein